jgi:hypothetical protein
MSISDDLKATICQAVRLLFYSGFVSSLGMTRRVMNYSLNRVKFEGVAIFSENWTVIKPFMSTFDIFASRGIFGLVMIILTLRPVLLSMNVLKETFL